MQLYVMNVYPLIYQSVVKFGKKSNVVANWYSNTPQIYDDSQLLRIISYSQFMRIYEDSRL